MPELPEVETVRRSLEKPLVGKTFGKPEVFYRPVIHSDYEAYLQGVAGKKVVAVRRKGKYLSFVLEDGHTVLFHLRMEGKLFIVPKATHTLSHLSLFLPFEGSEDGLAFYDVRKFGVTYYLAPGEEGPLSGLGPEPSEVKDVKRLWKEFSHSSRPIKELLLDQSILSGLGNIYSDEVLFESHLSPFRPGKTLTEEETGAILRNAQKVLAQAIKAHGSTVHTYRASPTLEGEFQEKLRVYGREGKKCLGCHDFRIQKRQLSGRGTSFCPKCQHTGVSLALTGKIGSGKSLALAYFVKEGYLPFSADEEVARLYRSRPFLKRLRRSFPMIFTPALNKKKIGLLLLSDKKFRRDYQAFLFAEVKKALESFLLREDGKNTVCEIPLLFDAHLEKEFTYRIGVETTHQKAHLRERGDKEIEERLRFNELNSYDRHRHELDFILSTDGPKKELREEVRKIAADIRKRLSR
jgi:formamidopyrimidine-DNA glycosylase